MTYVLGLTGSIGMGKSTTAQMFAEEGIPVWDADAVVAKLYSEEGPVSREIISRFPDVEGENGVDKQKLRSLISDQPAILDQVQSIVHPAVAKDRTEFIFQTQAPLVVLDIPLLFEIGADVFCDGVVVVSVDAEEQKRRVLARNTMNEQEFKLILSRQMSDEDKRGRANWVIETDEINSARYKVRKIIEEIGVIDNA